MRHVGRTLLLTAAVSGLWTPASRLTGQVPARLSDSALAALVMQLSETGGYFDTDNLISNEDSYLLPISTLRKVGTTGGAYIGVGPDQNFSYIAAVRPRVAFILDIRRDNLLELTLFKAIFALSHNRAEYLCLLFGRNAPSDTTGWGAKPAAEILTYVDTVHTDSVAVSRIAARVLAAIRRSALQPSAADLKTISRFHRVFIDEGPELRFNTFGRAPNPSYPDFRRLALEKDRAGKEASFLSTEERFQFVKGLEDRNLVVPVVGDFGGEKALPSISKWIADHGERVSVFYTSNVEQYLFRDGGFIRFARTVSAMPKDERSVMIRSCFQCRGHAQAAPGYYSIQMAQRITSFARLFANGSLSNYFELTTRELVDP